MSLKRLTQFLLQLCVLTSFITYIIKVDFILLDKLTISEIFGGLGILLFGFINRKEIITIFKNCVSVYKYAFCLFSSFFIGVFITQDLYGTILGIFVFFYLLLLSITFYNAFYNDVFLLVKTVILTFFIMIIIGFYDYFALKNNLYTIFPNANARYLISGFRSFGQVGDYTFCILTFLIPFQFSNYSLKLNEKWRFFLRITVFMGIVFVFGTVRVSAILSLFLALFLFFFLNRNFTVIRRFYFEIILVFVSLLIIKFNFESLYQYLWDRLNARIFKRNESYESMFIVENFNFAIKLFLNNPIFGNSIITERIPVYNVEIHGTYLKLLAESGLLGVFCYFLFIKDIWSKLKSKMRNNNHIGNFIRCYFPFFLSSLVMWFYDFHLRKKEFWIVLALILIIAKVSEQKTELEEK